MQPEEFRFDFLQCGEFTTDADGSLSEKSVPFYIIAQAAAGHYELSADGVHVELPEGAAFVTRPFQSLSIRHHAAATGLMTVRYIHFHLLRHNAVDPLAGYRLPLQLDLERSRRIGERISSYLALGDDLPSAVRKLTLAGEITALLLETAVPGSGTPCPAWLLEVLAAIRRHPARSPSPAKLCRASGKSRALFYREFTRHTGVAPAEFIRREKVRLAAELKMAHPEYSVAELAQAAGFANPFHFSRVFRRVTGVPPGRFSTDFRDPPG